MSRYDEIHKVLEYDRKNGVSAGKRDQIDKKFFFEIINVLDQMIKSTSILLKNFFLKKISIWFLFPALTPYDLSNILNVTEAKTCIISKSISSYVNRPYAYIAF